MRNKVARTSMRTAVKRKKVMTTNPVLKVGNYAFSGLAAKEKSVIYFYESESLKNAQLELIIGLPAFVLSICFI